jgi:hypothetical protein
VLEIAPVEVRQGLQVALERLAEAPWASLAVTFP